MQTRTHSLMGDLQLSTYPCCSLQPPDTSIGQGLWLGWASMPPACSQVLTAPWGPGSAVPVRGQGGAGCLCWGHIRF